MSNNSNISNANVVGMTFKATAEGTDPLYPEVNGFVPGGLYIRMRTSDGSLNYIDAFEIDKAIGIIGEKTASKANQTVVDELQDKLEEKIGSEQIETIEQTLDEKASSVELQQISNDVKNKADRSTVDDLSNAISYKANTSDVSNLKKELMNKIATESLFINNSLAEKANKSSIESLKADIEALKKASGTVTNTGSLSAIEKQIALLEEELNNRLSVDALNPVNDSIDELDDAIRLVNGKIYTLEKSIEKKAAVVYVQNQINELNHAITSLSNIVDGKANRVDLNKKANKDELVLLKDKLIKLTEKLNTSVKEFTKSIGDITTEVSKKADKKETETSLREIRSSLDSKADYKSTNDAIIQINKKLTSYESDFDDFDDKYVSKHELNDAVTEVKIALDKTDNAHDKMLETHKELIRELQKKDIDLETKAANQWIRVLSQSDYDKMPNYPYMADGVTINPKAKQPNVIYLIMKYNAPVALYIGTVQIAKAETINGSTGFAYTFPIIF